MKLAIIAHDSQQVIPQDGQRNIVTDIKASQLLG